MRSCREQNIDVVSLPGASAAITALAGSGLPTYKFIFIGFLPKTEPKLIRAVQETKDIEVTLIAYESPQRITKTITLIEKNFPEARVVIARELTKLHEEYLTGSATEVLQSLKNKPSIKGEITLLLSFK